MGALAERSQRPPAQNVPVHVKDGLAGVGAGIEDEPPTVCDALGRCHRGRSHGQLTSEPGTGDEERTEIVVVLPRDDQDMRRRTWVDVAEGQDPVGLPDDVGRYLGGDDSAEQAGQAGQARGLVK